MMRHPASTRDAMTICQDVLDILSDALMARDLETVAAHVTLPCIRRTMTSEAVFETRKDLDDSIIAFSRLLHSIGTNQYVRLVSRADFIGPDYISGHHVTHIMRDGRWLVPSFAGRVTLQRSDGAWKMTELDSNLTTDAKIFDFVSVAQQQGPFSPDGLPEEDVRHHCAEGVEIYQTFLDALTQANLDGDFDGYCALCDFPYGSHTAAHDIMLERPEDVRPFFDMISETLSNLGADDFRRTAGKAEFLSGRRIVGYHDAVMLRDTSPVLGPIRSRMILHREGVRWLLKSVTNAISNTEFPYTEPRATDELVTIRQIQERTKTWPTSH